MVEEAKIDLLSLGNFEASHRELTETVVLNPKTGRRNYNLRLCSSLVGSTIKPKRWPSESSQQTPKTLKLTRFGREVWCDPRPAGFHSKFQKAIELDPQCSGG
jgi:hypothetical protein